MAQGVWGEEASGTQRPVPPGRSSQEMRASMAAALVLFGVAVGGALISWLVVEQIGVSLLGPLYPVLVFAGPTLSMPLAAWLSTVVHRRLSDPGDPMLKPPPDSPVDTEIWRTVAQALCAGPNPFARPVSEGEGSRLLESLEDKQPFVVLSPTAVESPAAIAKVAAEIVGIPGRAMRVLVVGRADATLAWGLAGLLPKFSIQRRVEILAVNAEGSLRGLGGAMPGELVSYLREVVAGTRARPGRHAPNLQGP
jgi:hypothetical protein